MVKSERHQQRRGYLICKQCGRPLTGSASHGHGGKYYNYHCQASLGCKERVKASEANDNFLKYLKTFRIRSEVLDLYLMIMKERFKKGKSLQLTENRELEARIQKLSTRRKNAKEMMLDGEMERSKHKQILSELEPELDKLKRKKATAGSQDDYQLYLVKGFCLLKSIDQRYEKANLEKRQQIVGGIFPDKLVYSEGTYRITTPHPLFEVITTTEAALEGRGKTKGQHFADLSCQVAPRPQTSNILLDDWQRLAR